MSHNRASLLVASEAFDLPEIFIDSILAAIGCVEFHES